MSIVSTLFTYFLKQTHAEYKRVTLSLLEKNTRASLLDCGCDTGEFTLSKAEKIETRNIYGIDMLEESLNKAKTKGIKVYKGDLNEKLSFESESFDVVTANAIIEHLSKTDLFLQEIRRVLKIGGYLVISTPNLASFPNILFLLLGLQPIPAYVSDEIIVGTWYPLGDSILGGKMPAHRRLFTLKALKELLEYYGFKVETSRGCGFAPLPLPVARLMCFIDKRHADHIIIKARKK